MSAGLGGRRDVLISGLLPTLAAMVAASILYIERVQLDWAADCNAPGVCDSAFTLATPNDMSAWLIPIFVFAIFHAMLVRYPAEIEVPRLNRTLRVLIFFAISCFPFFLWFLFFAGVAFGFLAAITIVGLPFMFLVGVMGGGLVAGVVLAVAAGPSFKHATWPVWKSLVWRYGKANLLATAVFAGGNLLFDPQFSWITPEHPGIGAFGVIANTALACMIISRFVLTGADSGASIVPTHIWRKTYATVAAASVFLMLAAQVMVSYGATVFARTDSFAETVVAFVRANKPPSTTKLLLAGFDFVGDRAIITDRGVASRSRTVCETQGAGTDTETSLCNNVVDVYSEWQVRFPGLNTEYLFITADGGGGETVKLYCQPKEDRIELCLLDTFQSSNLNTAESERRVAYNSEDAFEFSIEDPETSLAIRYDANTQADGTQPNQWKRIYCRLNLVNVGAAKFSVHQIVPCSSNWEETAKQIRIYVDGLFVSVKQTVNGLE
jgi:hypothetical protein